MFNFLNYVQFIFFVFLHIIFVFATLNAVKKRNLLTKQDIVNWYKTQTQKTQNKN
jgi:hypothetical protein